ncbi:MAG TPA: preprotein translocase subunit SecY [Candidatus Paceibacterota bacterium]|nr:preprotein translocase subunit SecY [Candidatus Paceibacterota bacterium]
MDTILQIFRRPEIRNKVLFILALMAVAQLAHNVPIPAVDASRLRDFLNNNQLFGLVSTFTGGSLSTLSVAMLGLGPYITATIIMQLLTMIFPSLEQMYKYEGEAGRTRFNQYSRILTVPLAMVQGYAFLTLLTRQSVIAPLGLLQMLSTLVIVTAGSVFLMWLGELITEKNLGNGVSLLILAGIVARFPSNLQQAIFTYTPDQLFTYVAFVLVSLAVIVGVIYISEAQRNITVNYARRVRGMRQYGGVSTYLPMRVNNAGVIPIIFALSLLLFPGVIANFFASSHIAIVAHIATAVATFLQQNLWYSILYFIFVVIFTYFYTAITFDPKSIAENIQKQGGYIPGIRPGPQTASFLNHLLNRVTLVGAIFLGTIAILPNIVRGATGVSAFTIGGTSILIVVSVALEVMKQIQAQLSLYEY